MKEALKKDLTELGYEIVQMSVPIVRMLWITRILHWLSAQHGQQRTGLAGSGN
jgi:hypothetical protein